MDKKQSMKQQNWEKEFDKKFKGLAWTTEKQTWHPSFVGDLGELKSFIRTQIEEAEKRATKKTEERIGNQIIKEINISLKQNEKH